MAESAAFIGIGTKFQRQSAGSSWEAVGEVYNISGPTTSRDTVEVTHYQSPDSYREKIGGLRDGGQVTFTMNFTRAGYLIIKGDFDDDDRQKYRIILPDEDETIFEFSGLVTECPMSIPEGDRVTVDVTIEVSGAVQIDEET